MTKAASGRAYHHGELRHSALSAALEILRTEGEARLSMREVAKRVGVAHRALYHWYSDRESLMIAIAAHGFSSLADTIEAALLDPPRGDSPRHAMARAYLRFAFSEPELYRVTMNRDRADRKRSPDLSTALERMVTLSASVFDAEEADPRDAVVAMWAQLHGVVSLKTCGMLATSDDASFEDWAVALTDRIGPAA